VPSISSKAVGHRFHRFGDGFYDLRNCSIIPPALSELGDVCGVR
jgi:hypothetical protein